VGETISQPLPYKTSRLGSGWAVWVAGLIARETLPHPLWVTDDEVEKVKREMSLAAAARSPNEDLQSQLSHFLTLPRTRLCNMTLRRYGCIIQAHFLPNRWPIYIVSASHIRSSCYDPSTEETVTMTTTTTRDYQVHINYIIIYQLLLFTVPCWPVIPLLNLHFSFNTTGKKNIMFLTFCPILILRHW